MPPTPFVGVARQGGIPSGWAVKGLLKVSTSKRSEPPGIRLNNPPLYRIGN